MIQVDCDPQKVGFILMKASLDPAFYSLLARSPKAALAHLGFADDGACDTPVDLPPPFRLMSIASQVLVNGEEMDAGQDPQVATFFKCDGPIAGLETAAFAPTSVAAVSAEGVASSCEIGDLATAGFLQQVTTHVDLFDGVQNLETRAATLQALGVPADIIANIPDNASLPDRTVLQQMLGQIRTSDAATTQIGQFWDD